MVALVHVESGKKPRKEGKMKSLMMTVAAALCCVAMADDNAADALRDGARRGMPHAGDPILRAVSNPATAKKLGLSDEQKAKLKEITGAARSGRDKQKKVRDAAVKQLELMKADKIDEAAVMQAIDEVFDLRRDLAKEQAKRVIAVKSILTPEQVAKLHEEAANMGAGRGPRRPGQPGGRRGRGQRDGGRPAKPDAE